MPIFGQHNNKCKMYISFRYLHQNSIYVECNCIRLIARSQLQSMYCGMWWWLYIPSWGYHAYFCNLIHLLLQKKYMQCQVMIDLVWPLHIPTTYLIDSWPIFGAINDAICDNCCVYHTSISIISIVPNTMRSNLIHGSRLSSNNTKVDCCISSCLFLEYSCARCSYYSHISSRLMAVVTMSFAASFRVRESDG